jgi:hypothetical protein
VDEEHKGYEHSKQSRSKHTEGMHPEQHCDLIVLAIFYAPYIETYNTHPVSNQWQYINKITLKGSTSDII